MPTLAPNHIFKLDFSIVLLTPKMDMVVAAAAAAAAATAAKMWKLGFPYCSMAVP